MFCDCIDKENPHHTHVNTDFDFIIHGNTLTSLMRNNQHHEFLNYFLLHQDDIDFHTTLEFFTNNLDQNIIEIALEVSNEKILLVLFEFLDGYLYYKNEKYLISLKQRLINRNFYFYLGFVKDVFIKNDERMRSLRK